MRWIGGVLALASCWPLYEALAALQQQDYLAGALLVALTWVVARTGSDLAVLAERKEDA